MSSITIETDSDQEDYFSALGARYACEEREEEPTQEQQDALQAYIEAREEHEALLDDLHYGSTGWERAEARRKLPAATLAKIEAHNEAHRLGVLEVGRRLFR